MAERAEGEVMEMVEKAIREGAEGKSGLLFWASGGLVLRPTKVFGPGEYRDQNGKELDCFVIELEEPCSQGDRRKVCHNMTLRAVAGMTPLEIGEVKLFLANVALLNHIATEMMVSARSLGVSGERAVALLSAALGMARKALGAP